MHQPARRSYSARVSPCFPFCVCPPPLKVPETPGDEAALLPYSIMNEGGFQPAHSSPLSCQARSAHPAHLDGHVCVHVCIRDYTVGRVWDEVPSPVSRDGWERRSGTEQPSALPAATLAPPLTCTSCGPSHHSPHVLCRGGQLGV